MYFLIFFSFLLSLVCPFETHAQGQEAFGDYAVASTLKNLAKAYVQTVDLEALKAKHLKILSKMTESKFQQRYLPIYNILQDIPPSLRVRYGLKKKIIKQEAMASIQRLDKKDILEIIDEIPDTSIVRYVNYYLSQSLNALHQDPLAQINALWQKVLKKA